MTQADEQNTVIVPGPVNTTGVGQPTSDAQTGAIESAEQFLQLATSRSFKERVAAYGCLARFPEHIGQLQNETMVPAIDALLDGIAECPGPLGCGAVAGLFAHAAHSKTGIRNKVDALIARVLQDDPEETMATLCTLLDGRNARLVERMAVRVADVLNGLVETGGDVAAKSVAGLVAPRLLGLLNSSDAAVRKAAIGLCVGVYRVVYDGIDRYIAGAKPILLKELQDEFARYEKPRVAVSLATLRCDDADWKERLAGMNVLKESLLDPNDGELVGLLVRRLREANIMVVQAAVECVRNGRVRNTDVVRAMLLRLRDKKPQLAALIRETAREVGVELGLLLDLLTNREQKNPEVRIGLLECVIAHVAEHEAARAHSRLGEVAFLLGDGNADVRSKAAALLAYSDLSLLSEEHRSKVEKLCKNERSSISKEVSKEPHQNTTINDTPSEPASKRPSIHDQPCRSTEDFLEKYALFQEKDWNKKLIQLREKAQTITREPLPVLIEFVVHSKESNFNILRELLRIIALHPSIGTNKAAPSLLCPFLLSKASEAKLRQEVVALYSAIGAEQAADSLLRGIAGSTGKRMIASLEILADILEHADSSLVEHAISSLSSLSFAGMIERSAIEKFKATFNSKRKSENIKESENVRESKCIKQINEKIDPSPLKQPINQSSKRVHSTNQTTEHPHYFPVFPLPKDPANLEAAFSAAFLALMETDPYSALGLLADSDRIASSGSLIQLYVCFSLPAPHFDALIDAFVASRYILLEREARILISHLLGNAMEAELDLVDRIYPATRLFRLYQSCITDPARSESAGIRQCALEQIAKLLLKYRKITVNLSGEKERGCFLDAVIGSDAFGTLAHKVLSIPQAGGHVSASAPRVPSSEPVIPSTSFVPFSIEAPKRSECSRVDEHAKADSLSYIEDSFIVEDVAVEKPIEEISKGTDDSNNVNTNNINTNNISDLREVLKAPSILTELPKDNQPSITVENNGTPMPRADLEEPRIDLEDSLANISITTTPKKKKKRDFVAIDSIMGKLIHADSAVSKQAFHSLVGIASTDISSLVFLSNSIVGSITIQLFDKYADQELRRVILSSLLKLTQSAEFCASLRYETLRSASADLARIVDEETAAADILINLCLNCPPDILRVYFDLLESDSLVIVKLIWRHSKRVDYAAEGVAQAVLAIVDSFYHRKGYLLSRAGNMVLKVCLLHLKDICVHYSDGAKQFGLGPRTAGVIDLLLSGRDLNLDDVRLLFK